MHLGCGCDEPCNDAETCFCVAQHGCFYDEEGNLKGLNGMTAWYEERYGFLIHMKGSDAMEKIIY